MTLKVSPIEGMNQVAIHNGDKMAGMIDFNEGANQYYDITSSPFEIILPVPGPVGIFNPLLEPPIGDLQTLFNSLAGAILLDETGNGPGIWHPATLRQVRHVCRWGCTILCIQDQKSFFKPGPLHGRPELGGHLLIVTTEAAAPDWVDIPWGEWSPKITSA